MRLNIRIFPKIVTASEQEIVLENFLSLTALQTLMSFLPLLILPYLLRIIGPSNFGLICFAQALMQYFMIITDYGFSLSATREISLYQDNKEKTCRIFSCVMTVKIILTAISFLILLGIIHFIPKFKQDYLVYLVSFGAVIGSTLFPAWFFQGKEEMKHILFLNSLGGIANAICIFVYVRMPADFIFVPIFNSFFGMLTGVWGWRIAAKEFKLKFTPVSYKDILRELKNGWRVFASIVAINAYTATRVFAVGLLTNNTLTGYYAAAERIANFIQTFPQLSFVQAVYPRLNRVFMKNRVRAVKIMRHIQDMASAGFIVCLPIVFVLSGLIMEVFCGAPYKEAVMAFRLLLISVFFIGANALKVQFLLICGEFNLYSKLHITAALIGLPLIFFLIYHLSYLGAPIATVIIEAGVFFATAQILKKVIHKKIPSLK